MADKSKVKKKYRIGQKVKIGWFTEDVIDVFNGWRKPTIDEWSLGKIISFDYEKKEYSIKMLVAQGMWIKGYITQREESWLKKPYRRNKK